VPENGFTTPGFCHSFGVDLAMAGDPVVAQC